MRGRKSYNIRNIEAHIHNIHQVQEPIFRPIAEPSFLLNRQLIFNNQVNHKNHNNHNNHLNNDSQIMNEYINAKYGVSRYASNQVSGKMFKKI
uniref:Uncharacterized protein n=1 Tax=viral metagenome TaxID=1070528 RepID=A0A6C0KP41_9ZZZZ